MWWSNWNGWDLRNGRILLYHCWLPYFHLFVRNLVDWQQCEKKKKKKVMIVTALPSMIESSPIHRCSFLLSARFCFQFVFKRQLLVSLWRVNNGETFVEIELSLVKWAFSLCAYWLALLSKKLHFCIFRLWKKSGAIFASFDGLCGCQDDRNPRVHLLFPCERGRSMTLSYPQGAWNILASQAGVVGVLLLLLLQQQQCSAVQAGSSGFSTLLCVIKCGRYVRSLVIGAIYIGRHHFFNYCKKSGFMEELSTK